MEVKLQKLAARDTHCRSCMLSMVVEGVFLSIYRSSIIIQDTIITFYLNPYLVVCVQCIFSLFISIQYSGSFCFLLYHLAIIHFIYI